MQQAPRVTPISDISQPAIEALLLRYGLRLAWVADGAEIPGSYWRESEAGLIGNTLYARRDTPVHSVLHESCHYLCMDPARRATLHTDAGGNDIEECGVCYLEILLADQLPGYSRDKIFADMDAWGYHFRLGSTQTWFEQDAEDAQKWLTERKLNVPPQPLSVPSLMGDKA